jgi:hypothetical protein
MIEDTCHSIFFIFMADFTSVVDDSVVAINYLVVGH